jgi:hypothetical protein
MKRVSLPLRIAAWYGLFGLIWIFLSDWLVGRIGLDAAQLQTIQTLKGSVFVLASVAFVYVVAHLEGNKTDAARTAAERAFRLLEEALGIANTAAFMFDRRTSQFELSAGVRRVLGLANTHASRPVSIMARRSTLPFGSVTRMAAIAGFGFRPALSPGRTVRRRT